MTTRIAQLFRELADAFDELSGTLARGNLSASTEDEETRDQLTVEVAKWLAND